MPDVTTPPLRLFARIHVYITGATVVLPDQNEGVKAQFQPGAAPKASNPE